MEVQTTGAQRPQCMAWLAGRPHTEPRAVRALAVLQRPVLTVGRHEPYESRGSRADLWGPAGEIPAGYPANGRVLHRRPSESRWPRVMRWRPARAQRSVHRGARRPVIEPRNGSDIGVPTRSKTSEGNTAGGVFASRPRTPRGLRTRHVCDLSMLRTGRSHGHPPVVMEGRVVRGRPRP